MDSIKNNNYNYYLYNILDEFLENFLESYF